MKRLMLLLFSVFAIAVICSVSAIKTDYSQWDSNKTTNYCVLYAEDDDVLKDLFDNADWTWKAPKVVNIKDHRVYFASESDLYRAIAVESNNNRNVLGHMKTICVDGELQAVTAIYGAGNDGEEHDAEIKFSVNKNNTKIVYVTWEYGVNCWDGSWTFNKIDDVNLGYNKIGVIYVDEGTHTFTCAGDQAAVYGGAEVSTTLLVFGKVQNFEVVEQGISAKKLYEIVPMSILEVYTEPGANIYLDGSLIGTSDNGGYFKKEVEGGEHQLKISKDGFWDYTKTITIQNDSELHIDLVPKTSIIGLGYNLTERTYPDSIGTMDIKLTPIVDAYGTTLKLSGADIVSVCYNGNNLEAVNGKYILGDLSKGVQTELLIKFKTPSSFGKKSFTANIEATDVEGNAYSQNEIIEYNVEELPFLVELPAWKLGDNAVRITDTSGTSYGVSLVLYDKDGNEVWSDSQSMLEYGECDFTISITSPGDYVLEISGAGAKTYKEIHLIEPISIITKTISAGKGEVATVKFSIINPSNSVKYYYATLDCELMNLSANKTLKQFAVSPNENKTVELSFKVPSDAQYDSYSLNLNVYDSDTKELLYSNMVVLDIVESSLIPVGDGDSTVLILAAVVGVLLIAGIGMYFVRK